MSGQGCASGVVPVLIVGGQLLGAAGLNHIHPFGKLDLTGLLQEAGEGHCEMLLVNVLDSDGRHRAKFVEKETGKGRDLSKTLVVIFYFNKDYRISHKHIKVGSFLVMICRLHKYMSS